MPSETSSAMASSLTLPVAASLDGQAASLIAQVMHDFATSLDVEEALQHAIDQVISYLGAEAASIFLLDDGGALVCRKCAGPVDIAGLRLRADEGIVGEAVRHNALRLVRDVAENPSFAAGVDQGTGFVTRSILCVPLTVRGTCIGALELMNKRYGDGLFATADLHLATAVAAAAALAIHNARMAQALIEQERVRKELELARAIQLSLLPGEGTQGLPVYGINIPAREVSGDFYDYFALPDGRIYFSIGDVAGKGMNAALLMAKTTSLLRCLAKVASDPGSLLARVNEEICETASMGLFVTLIAGFIDPARDVLWLANAGHQPALVRHPDGRFQELRAGAPPLGILPDVAFPTERLALAGHSVYLYTDGVTESQDPAGRPLGIAGLSQLLDSCLGLSPATRMPGIVTVLEAQSRRFSDDLTLVLIEGNGDGPARWSAA